MVTPQHSASRDPARAPRRLRAFTLIEVMTVLVLLGILAAVILPRMRDMGQDRVSTIELLKVRLRYAQMRSLNNVSVHGVRSTGSSYWLFSDGDITHRELFPGATSTTITLPAGITMDSFTVSFDTRGAPYTDAAATAGSELAADSAAAVRVTPGTGYVRD
jgi:MSHA pilin protein MshC